MIPESSKIRIQSLLEEIEETHDVRVLFAVESGSRAWGFASPDSDFDVRFIYQEPIDRMLRLFPGRDVIEEMHPHDVDGSGVPIDLVGWSLTKALRLGVASNPQLCEWVRNEAHYMERDGFRDRLTPMTQESSPRVLAHHYRGLAKKTQKEYLEGPEDPKGKKYLYAVRAVLASEFMVLHPERGAAPPVPFEELRKKINIAEGVDRSISDLLEWKMKYAEKDGARRFPVLDDWINDEITRLEKVIPEIPDPVMDKEIAEGILEDFLQPRSEPLTAFSLS